MPSSARQRATSRPTRRSGASSRLRNRPARAAPPASRTALPFSWADVLQLGLEVDHPLLQRGVGGGEDAHGEQPGVAGVADRDRGHRDAGRHLHDREQRVHAVEVLQRHRHADHRQRRDRRRACPGRWAAPPAPAMITWQPAAGGLLAVGQHLLGHPVRGDHVGLVGDVELAERRRGRLHHRPVGVGPHHDADAGGPCSLTRSRLPGLRGTTRRRAAPAPGSRRGRRRRR